MKILMISAVLPDNIDSGKKVVLNGLLQYFLERYGAKSVYYLFVTPKSAKINSNIPYQVIRLDAPGNISKIFSVCKDSFVLRKKSIQESIFFSNQLQRQIFQQIDKIKPDMIIADTIRMGQFFEKVEHHRILKIIYLDDLFSVRYQRMLENMRANPSIQMNPLGNFDKFIPKSLRSIVTNKWILNLLLKFERNRTYQSEIKSVNYFDKCLLISELERKTLMERTGRNNVFELRPYLSIKKQTPRNYTGEKVFVFLGALNLAHNEISLLHFLKTQIHYIKKYDFKIRVIGKNAKKELIRLAKDHPENIILEGYVEDLNEIFSTSCAMIAPLLFGSGVKLKVIEALAQGLPVISTDYGIEGVNVTPDVDCIVENDIDQFPLHMLKLCDPSFNERISANAKQLFEKQYSKDVVFREYDHIFRTILGGNK